MLCPRREETGAMPGGVFNVPAEDNFEGGRCSWCGSASAEAFLEAVKAGHKVTPTDKNYKAYIEGIPSTVKFYFQHLSDEQKNEFIQLCNDKKVNMGFPGHFYVLPYFCARVEKA